MRDDDKRKLMQTMYNLYREDAFRLDVPLLSRLSGRPPKRVVRTLTELVDEERIEWDRRTGAAKIIKPHFIPDINPYWQW